MRSIWRTLDRATGPRHRRAVRRRGRRRAVVRRDRRRRRPAAGPCGDVAAWSSPAAPQFLAVGLVAAGGSPVAAMLAGLLLNARHLPFGLAVGDVLGGGWPAPAGRQPHADRRDGRVRARPATTRRRRRARVLAHRRRALRHAGTSARCVGALRRHRGRRPRPSAWTRRSRRRCWRWSCRRCATDRPCGWPSSGPWSRWPRRRSCRPVCRCCSALLGLVFALPRRLARPSRRRSERRRELVAIVVLPPAPTRSASPDPSCAAGSPCPSRQALPDPRAPSRCSPRSSARRADRRHRVRRHRAPRGRRRRRRPGLAETAVRRGRGRRRAHRRPAQAGRNPVTTVEGMPEFAYSPLLPLGPDATEYRLVTSDGIGRDGRFLTVDPEALTRLTDEAMHDIAHFLRPAHLAQLRSIIDDPEASPQRPVRRAGPAAQRQHRGRRRAADVPGHRHRDRHGQARPARAHRRRATRRRSPAASSTRTPG